MWQNIPGTDTYKCTAVLKRWLMQANSYDIQVIFLKDHGHPQFAEMTASKGNPHLILSWPEIDADN